ncbi:MAG: hypothetical protein N2202_05475, partial [Proteobacteria bacterium]|nr:hypothetical protein [Pseudomonadota bacterium]
YIAQQADSFTQLPSLRFQCPEDAERQIVEAIDFIERIFGVRPQGMWPSEGSVSNNTLEIMAKNGIIWTASDEQVLLNSLKKHQRMLTHLTAEQLYKNYLFVQNNQQINMFFRDRRLSDDIGFVYSRMSAQEAVNHFMKSLYNIKNSLNNHEENNIVSIILDGENAWEFYEQDGGPFLKLLYQTIDRNTDFEIINYSDFLKDTNKKNILYDIAPGSWINGNFKIWIGHPEDNEAWVYLTKARDLVERNKEKMSKADLNDIMQYINIAEGSDWCWWYGDEHSTEFQLEFDELFRNNLKMIYKILGIAYPSYLDIPIVSKEKVIKPDKEIMNFITPKIDGKISSYFEWMGSYVFNLKKFGFAMHRTTTYVETLYLGLDNENIYFRLDPDFDFHKITEQSKIKIEIAFPEKNTVLNGFIEDKKISFKLIKENEEYQIDSAYEKIIEIKVPRKIINFSDGEKINFYINIQPEIFMENLRFPGKGVITAQIPPHNFEDYIWQA